MARPSAKRQAALLVMWAAWQPGLVPAFWQQLLAQCRCLRCILTWSQPCRFPALLLLQVDAFSFSIVCWECLTGEVPWRELAGHMQIIFAVGVNHEVSTAASALQYNCLRRRSVACMRRLHTRLLATGGHTCLSLMYARFPRLVCRPWMQRLPLPDSCPAFLRQLIEDCWAEDPAARPGFPAIRQRLQQELDRVAGDSAQQAQRTDCRSTVSESNASSAAAGGSGSRSGWPGSLNGGSGSGGGGVPTPAPVAPESLHSSFGGHAAPFSGVSGSSSDGSGS